MTTRITALPFIPCVLPGNIFDFDFYSISSTLHPHLTLFPSLFDCRLPKNQVAGIEIWKNWTRMFLPGAPAVQLMTSPLSIIL